MSDTDEDFFDTEARLKLGRTIALWMSSLGFSKISLARDAGLSRSTLDAILNGSRTASLERLAKISSAFHTTPGALLDGRMPTRDLSQMMPDGDGGFIDMSQFNKAVIEKTRRDLVGIKPRGDDPKATQSVVPPSTLQSSTAGLREQIGGMRGRLDAAEDRIDDLVAALNEELAGVDLNAAIARQEARRSATTHERPDAP